MKRLLLIFMLLFSAYLSLPAQNFLDLYRNGTVTQSIPVADVDQLRVSKPTSSGRNVNIYRDGRLWLSYDISNVDSIKVYRPTDEQLVYLGIIGFNQELYVQPFGILAESTANTFNRFVNNLTYRDGTILYYAVDNALDMLSNFKFNTSLSSVNLITFTDGLDQGSLMMNSNYSTETAYLNALSGRISSMKVAGHPLTAYSLGMRGNDVSDNTMFTTNLRKLASSADKATEVSSIYDVESQLQEIADQIISVSTRKSISVRIPGPATGTTVRFVFDGKSPESSSLYIEGVFNMNDMSLTKIRYQGIKASSGSVVKGTRDGIFVTFTFTDLQLADGSGLFSTSNMRQYNKAPGSTAWQVNSEFSPDSNVQTTVTYSGCAIMLVLDCSRSLGSDFSSMQSYVVDFINKIARNTADFEVLAPTDLTAKLTYSFSKLGVELSWLASKHADSYIVYRSKSASGSYTKIAENITSTRWNDSSLLSGMNYYKVVAVSAGLQSPESNVASVNYAVEQPENLSAKLAERNGKLVVDLTWSASQNAQSYLVYRSSSASGTYTKVGSSTTNTWTDYHASSGMNYYKVEAVGYGLCSGLTSYVSVNYNIPAPKNLRVSLSETEGVVLSWSASTGAQSYTVYRSNSFWDTYSVVAENIVSTSWTDSSPLSGENCYIIVAIGYGSSVQSDVVCINTLSKYYTVNGVSFAMIPVEGGTFKMGAEYSYNNQKPVHEVKLDGFFIGQTEVTRELWRAVMGSDPSYYFNGIYFIGTNHPVQNVSWDDCQTFISKLNSLTGEHFRLPTEAEWEYAARGGNQSKGYKYSGSNNIGDVAWNGNNSGSKTHGVATRAPNELGIYDMSGNVAEWCQDWYGDRYYYSSPIANPTGPDSGSSRVFRGGSWGSNPGDCGVADRRSYTPDTRYYSLGLRLAL